MPSEGFLGARKRLLNHLGPLRAYDAADLAYQADFDVAAVQPPAHDGHQQYQKRGQTENAVKGHGRAHAQTICIQPADDRKPQRAVNFLQDQQSGR